MVVTDGVGVGVGPDDVGRSGSCRGAGGAVCVRGWCGVVRVGDGWVGGGMGWGCWTLGFWFGGGVYGLWEMELMYISARVVSGERAVLLGDGVCVTD